MTAPAASHWLDRPGDTRLHWRRDGAEGGRPLLLIHEMGGALTSWDGVVASLGADWDCLRLDMRGCGQSSPISGTAVLDALVEDQIAIWDSAGLGSPATVVASAIGAAVAVTLAARYPGRVAQLMLLAPALGIPAEKREGVLAMADRLEADGVAPFVNGSLDASYPERLRQPEAFGAFLKTQLANDPASFAAYWRMLAGLDLADLIATIKSPISILAGSADLIRPPEQVQRIAGASFRIIDSGHFMALQTPKAVAAAIAQAELANQEQSA